MDKYSLYQSLLDAYSKAYPLKTKQQHQCDVTKAWNEIKKQQNYSELISKKILEYKEKSLQSKANLFSYWKSKSNTSTSVQSSNEQTDSNTQSTSGEILNLSNSFEELKVDCDDDQGRPEGTKLVLQNDNVPTPAQAKLQQEAGCLTAEIAALTKRKESGLLTDDMRPDLKKKRQKLSSLEKALCIKKSDMLRKRKSRRNFKAKLSKICENNPDVKKELKVSSICVQTSIICEYVYSCIKTTNTSIALS